MVKFTMRGVVTWRLSVDPVPSDRVVNRTSLSSSPDRSVLYQTVRVTNYELLKHVVNILIRNDRQCWVSSRTKLSCFIPTQHWTIGVETIVLTVHLVTLWQLVCLYVGGKYITYTCENTPRVNKETPWYCPFRHKYWPIVTFFTSTLS